MTVLRIKTVKEQVCLLLSGLDPDVTWEVTASGGSEDWFKKLVAKQNTAWWKHAIQESELQLESQQMAKRPTHMAVLLLCSWLPTTIQEKFGLA